MTAAGPWFLELLHDIPSIVLFCKHIGGFVVGPAAQKSESYAACDPDATAPGSSMERERCAITTEPAGINECPTGQSRAPTTTAGTHV